MAATLKLAIARPLIPEWSQLHVIRDGAFTADPRFRWPDHLRKILLYTYTYCNCRMSPRTFQSIHIAATYIIKPGTLLCMRDESHTSI